MKRSKNQIILNKISMPITKRIAVLAAAILLSVGFYSCEEDISTPENENKTPVKVMLKSTLNQPLADAVTLKSGNAMLADIQISQFLVNIDEFEFEVEDEWNASYDDDEVSVYGPWLVDLMSPDAFNGINIAAGQVPNDLYDEVEVDMDVSYDESNDNIYNRSVYIEGTIDQTPFVFWYDDDFDFEVEFDNNEIVEMTGEEILVMVEFQIPVLIDAFVNSLAGSVADGNGNGVIEIWNNDPDGNDDFVDNIIDAMEDAFDVDDDDDDDDYDDDWDDDDDDDWDDDDDEDDDDDYDDDK